MPKPTPEEEIATFATASFNNGEPADGAPTPEEAAAAAANARPALPAAGEGAEGGDEGGEQAGEGAEGGEGEGAAAEGGEQGQNAEKLKDGEDKPAKKGKPTAAERIGELTAKQRTAERRAEMAESRLATLEVENAALKSGKAPLTAEKAPAKDVGTPPDPSTFTYGELDPGYIAALARHETLATLAEKSAEDEATRQTQAAAATQQDRVEKINTFVDAGAEIYDDFREVVFDAAQAGEYPLSAVLGELMLGSDHGVPIVYELAQDHKEAARIAKLPDAQQAAWFGRQEAKFEAAKSSQGGKTPPKTPQAPVPPKLPKGGSGSNVIGADSTDFAAVEKAWRTGALH